MQLFTTGVCNAQTLDLKPAPANVIIDGIASEWGNTLPYTNDEAKISYVLSNDKTNLYLAVKTKDAVMQNDILSSGITFSVDTKGRKRNTSFITFPVSGQTDANAFAGMNTAQLNTELTKFSKIYMEGFKGVSDGQLKVKNAYGIQVAIGYDADGSLIYEEAIPLTLFNADVAANKEWAFNIKINGLQKKEKIEQRITVDRTSAAGVSGGSYSSGGSGGSVVVVTRASPGGSSSGSSVSGSSQAAALNNAVSQINADMAMRGYQPYKVIQLTPSIDFWGKFNLAKGL